MNAEQLQAARSAHWRQQQPLLTLDDAQSWLGQHPLCLYLPRRAQLPAPAPSFVEACLGKPQTMPGSDAMEQAHSLLRRLTASGAVVPLNLLGTVGEQPDFLATREALPFVLSLRADADWKHAPQKSSGHKVSPLVLELWKLLEEHGGLTAAEARTMLGRELTEAAVLRALAELWQGLRIIPVYGEDGQPARWEMMRMRHREALTTGAGTGQVTAISLLVSMYLQSVYAASSEEIEIFLSPVTSRSRVREAVRGLSATRQIHSLSMDAQTLFFLENGLPEFAAAVVAVEAAPTAVRPKRREHPITPAPGAIALPAVPQPEPDAVRAGWKSPQRAAGDTRTWRPATHAGASARKDKGRAAKPGGFRRTGAVSRPHPTTGGEGRAPFTARSGPPRSASAGGARPWRPKTTADSSGRDDRRGAAGPGGFTRTGAASRPRSGDGEGRAPFPPRSGPRSGPPRGGAAGGARPWRPKTTADPSAPLRSGRDDKGRAARPGGFARTGAASRPRSGGPPRPRSDSAGRPSFPPRSEPRSGPPRSASAGGAKPWRPKTTADPSAPLRSGRDGKGGAGRPGGFARTGAASRPRSGGPPRPRSDSAGRPPFTPRSEPRSGPPRGSAGGAKPWRSKTTAVRSGRDDKKGAARPGGFARTGAASRPRPHPTTGGEGRAPFPPPRSSAGGAKPWRPKTTADPSAPLRSGRDDKRGAARPGGFARTGAASGPRAGGEQRAPFKPRASSPRSGAAGGKPRSGPAKSKGPGDYPRRKPVRKKPGA